jgi:anion-transporting  ArsA/GET3 family ATPase
MAAAPILFVTGKGGTGKTTVACAAAHALARRGERVLLVEPYGQSGIAPRYGEDAIGDEPSPIADNLSAVHLRPRRLVEEYFRKLLRLPALARRLLSSSSFNAVTSAAPGVSEFLTLECLDAWSRERRFDRIVVDGPSTGHALQLLRAPFQLAEIARSGPLHRPLRRLILALRRSEHVRVAVISICEEMSVAESLEAHAMIGGRLGIALERPVLNRCPEHRFTQEDIGEIESLDPSHPLVRAAHLHLCGQRRAATFGAALKQEFDDPVLAIYDRGREPDDGELGRELLRGWNL